MNHIIRISALLILAVAVSTASAQEITYSGELDEISDDIELGEEIHWLEAARTEPADVQDTAGFMLRSRHLVFGLPRLTDERHRLGPQQAGVSVLVRDGFVIAYFERMKSPLWVAQRWTTDELEDKAEIAGLRRDWRKDPELPIDTHIGTSYAGNDTGLDRGHMAKHSMNRAWGYDSSIQGCLMSNSTPQHKEINRTGGAWYKLEEAVENAVGEGAPDIDVLWTISGALFRDEENPDTELPEVDFANVKKITSGFAVPDATYKIVAWFQDNGYFEARGYVFEQPHTVNADGELEFDLPDQDQPLTEFLVKIDDIEKRTGLDFFPQLKDNIENAVESGSYADMWE